jgi:hypothetical protein
MEFAPFLPATFCNIHTKTDMLELLAEIVMTFNFLFSRKLGHALLRANIPLTDHVGNSLD